MDQTAEIEKAADILRRGGVVAFATETVYGLGADATNPAAVAKIFSIKGRPSTNPLIVHVADAHVAQRYVLSWPDSAEKLSRAFWPGPITFVLAKNPEIVPAVTAGLQTVGVRAPNHPLALKLLRAFSGAVAAPSANRSNHISPTTAEHVRRDLGDALDLILDGGPCAVGIESTVLDLSCSRPAILRPGAVGREQIEAVIGPVDFDSSSPQGNLKNPSSSPGQEAVHYAPVAPTFRLGDPDAESFLKKLSKPLGRRRVLLIIPETKLAKCLREISDPGEIFEMPRTAEDYARQLYRALHDADDLHPDVIYVQEPPAGPEWDAVRDRIHRATRPIAFELP